MAALTLAAMNIPQSLGYTRIAGTPVITGLYSFCFPLSRSPSLVVRVISWWLLILLRRPYLRAASPARLQLPAPGTLPSRP